MNIHDKDIALYFNGQTLVCEAKASLTFVNKVSGKERYYMKQRLRQLQYKEKIEGLSMEERYLKQDYINELEAKKMI